VRELREMAGGPRNHEGSTAKDGGTDRRVTTVAFEDLRSCASRSTQNRGGGSRAHLVKWRRANTRSGDERGRDIESAYLEWTARWNHELVVSTLNHGLDHLYSGLSYRLSREPIRTAGLLTVLALTRLHSREGALRLSLADSFSLPGREWFE
jgi:hypothetical protein